ncbi:single-stranded DNA-binding protein [Kitasatospora arboriphila]
MATTERRFDRGTGDWVDGETSWVTVVAWRWLATNLVSSVNKGDPVVVSGRCGSGSGARRTAAGRRWRSTPGRWATTCPAAPPPSGGPSADGPTGRRAVRMRSARPAADGRVIPRRSARRCRSGSSPRWRPGGRPSNGLLRDRLRQLARCHRRCSRVPRAARAPGRADGPRSRPPRPGRGIDRVAARMVR